MSESAIDAPGQAGPTEPPALGTLTHPDTSHPDAPRTLLPMTPLPMAALLAAGSGGALATAFPGLGWWPAAPLAVTGLAIATRGQRPRVAAALGLLTGIAFFFPHLHWSGAYVGLLPWSALTLVEALYLSAMAAAFPLAWRAPGGRAGTITTLTGLWIAQEAARGRIPFGGFPWARLAFSQADAPTLGYAALGGAPLVSAAVAAVGACLAVAVTDLTTTRATPRTLAALLLTALAVTGGGALVPRPTGSDRSVAVAAVQGDVPEPGLDFNAERRAVLDNHAGATLALARQIAAGQAVQPDVVLWPENSSDIDPLRNADANAVITRATDAVKAPVLVGAILAEPAPKVSNAAILWGPAGSPAPGPGQRYVKRHPAPFAEYVPYRSFFRLFSDKVDLVHEGFEAGRTVGVLQTGQARLGAVICFEVAYDGLVRAPVRAGADVLVVQTNNATFGYTDESVQQLAMSRLRAVETGRSVVHISTVGVSALITPDGREVARSQHFTPEVLQARLPLRSTRTVAVRTGAAPEAVLGLAGVLLAAWAGLHGRRRGEAAAAATGNDGEESRDTDRDREQELPQ